VRRAAYRANIARGDFFVLRNLTAFLHRAMERSIRAGTIVGDIGCGEQPLRQRIESVGGKYIGIDVVQNRQGTVDVLAPITAVPLPDASFGVILCTEVLEHVADTSGAFSELGRLCQAGGTIIITTPFAYPLHEEPHDYVRLTPHQITQCAARNGLESVELTTAGDELQVLATVWCNLWSRSARPGGTVVRSAWNTLMRLPVNLLVAGMSPILHSVLPRKYFLSTFCILRKPSRPTRVNPG
jgi:SAM-dependent methyltransferase